MKLEAFRNIAIENFVTEKIGNEMTNAITVESVKEACGLLLSINKGNAELFMPSDEDIERNLPTTKLVVSIIYDYLKSDPEEAMYDIVDLVDILESEIDKLSKFGIQEISDTQLLIGLVFMLGKSLYFNANEDKGTISTLVGIPVTVEVCSVDLCIYNQ